MTPGRDASDRLGAALAAFVAAAGAALVVMDFVAGRDYLATANGLVPGLPLLAVGLATLLAASRRDVDISVWLALLVAAGVVVNLLVFWVKAGGDVWTWLIPAPPKWGVDFRDGLYEPARAFSVARSHWPPLTLVLGSAFTLLPLSAASAVQTGLLVCAAALAAAQSAVLAVKVVPDAGHARAGGDGPGRVGVVGLGAVAGVWLLTSYGFLYEVQRGNIDLYALVLSLLAVWLALRLPHSPWWPAIALALAVNLKLYPAILVVLLFWRYRLRALVPVLVANAVLLLVGGPGNTWRMLTWIVAETPGARPAVWTDMGAAGVAGVLRVVHPSVPAWTLVPLLLVPLAVWAATAVLVVGQGWSPGGAVLLSAACVPPMALLPAVSNDYRLVLFVFPLAVVAAALAGMPVRRGRLEWCLPFGVLGWLVVMLGRTTLAHGTALVGSKYFLAVVLQLLLLYVVWRLRPERESEGAGADGLGAPPGEEQPDRVVPLRA